MSTESQGPIYVTRGMKSVCDCGSLKIGNFLNVVQDHGVLVGKDQQPLLNTNDHKIENIIGYGKCSSVTNPTIQVQMGIMNGLGALVGLGPLNALVETLTGTSIVSAMQKTGLISCPCVPVTPMVWKKGDTEHILDGAPVLTMDSVLFCCNGGVITILPEKKDSGANGEESSDEPEPDVVQSAAQEALQNAIAKISAAIPASETSDSAASSADASASSGVAGSSDASSSSAVAAGSAAAASTDGDAAAASADGDAAAASTDGDAAVAADSVDAASPADASVPVEPETAPEPSAPRKSFQAGPNFDKVCKTTVAGASSGVADSADQLGSFQAAPNFSATCSTIVARASDTIPSVSKADALRMLAAVTMSVLPAKKARLIRSALGLGQAVSKIIQMTKTERMENLARNMAVNFPTEALDSSGLICDMSKLGDYTINQAPASIAGGGAVAIFNTMKSFAPQATPSFPGIICDLEKYGAVQSEQGSFSPGIANYFAEQGCGISYLLPNEKPMGETTRQIGLSLTGGALNYQTKEMVDTGVSPSISLAVTPPFVEE